MVVHRGYVLIPSSSGLRLEWRSLAGGYHGLGLNPFFIRSAVGIHATVNGAIVGSLNPFFIRSAVGIERRQMDDRRRHVLIPSSSGLRLEWCNNNRRNTIHRLNPFFIRSAVGMHSPPRATATGSVLIPSSSGLRLEYMDYERCVRTLRLNPFFIRSAVGMQGRVGSVLEGCLNPFFIRSAVGIPPTPRCSSLG